MNYSLNGVEKKTYKHCSAMTNKDNMDNDDYPNYRHLLEDNRLSLVNSLEVPPLFPGLRSKAIFNVDDEQSIMQNVKLTTDKEKAGAFLDKLATKGQTGFKVFLGLLEVRYPELYKQLSGKDPRPPKPVPYVRCPGGAKQGEMISQLAAKNAELANKVDGLNNELDQITHRFEELQRNNDILKNKHIKDMMKLQKFDSVQQKSKLYEYQLGELTTQQRNILATSLQFQKEKEAIQRQLRKLQVENIELTRERDEMTGKMAHEKRKSVLREQRGSMDHTAMCDSTLSNEMHHQIEKLRIELDTAREYMNAKDTDVEVTILRDDLRDKTSECERLAEEWQRSQNEVHTAEHDKIQIMSELEDMRYTCQSFERESCRYKDLYELNLKYTNRTEEDLKKARDDRNYAEMQIDSYMQERRRLLSQLHELHTNNIMLCKERNILNKTLATSTHQRSQLGYPDLGYAGGSQSESSKDGSRPNSWESNNQTTTTKETTLSTTTGTQNTSSEKKPHLHVDIQRQESIGSEDGQFRQRLCAVDSSYPHRSPVSRSSPNWSRSGGNVYATLQHGSKELEKDDGSTPSTSDSLESPVDELIRYRPLNRLRRNENVSIDVVPGTIRKRYTLNGFGQSLEIDDVEGDEEEEEEEEAVYDYPDSMIPVSLTYLKDYNYDLVELSENPEKET